MPNLKENDDAIRGAFEQLPEIAPLIKYAFYSKDTCRYSDKNGLGEKGLFFLNGAWYAYLHLELKNQQAILVLENESEDSDIRIKKAVDIMKKDQ